ncbi:MAG: hypothetical protein JWR18_2606 [Segetibacter sp.]|nr:hypothetical protein [Segetibacter sp.]
MKTINAMGKEYTIYSVTGKVASSNKNMETRVSGSGGGYNGSGYSAPVNIRSTTTVHDQIFLVDNSGKEHSFQLQNFDLACREGNELSVFWAIKKGKQRGEHIAVHNKTTENSFFDTGAIRRMFKPSWIIPIVLTIFLLYIPGGGMGVFLAFLTWIAYVVFTIKLANDFKKNFDPGQMN